MTSNKEWNPYINRLGEAEEKARETFNYDPTYKYISKNYSINSSNPVDDIETNFNDISSVYTYNTRKISVNVTSKWSWSIKAQKLARIWAITIDAAAKTLEATTQRVSRDPIRPLHRR